MKVMKFGGTSVGKPERMHQVAELIQRDDDIKSGTLEPSRTVKGAVKFRISVAGDGTWIAKYKDKQTQLDISSIAN